MTPLSAPLSLLARALVVVGLAALGACSDQPFATNVDLPLQVIQLSPADGAVDVGRGTTVKATFNLPVVEGSVSAESFAVVDTVSGDAVAGALAYDKGGDAQAPTITFTPAALLAYSTKYQVTLAGSDGDVAPLQRDTVPQGALLKTIVSTFTTEDPPPLFVVAIVPQGGATGVDPATTIALTFSEPVRCATLAAGLAVSETFDAHPHNGAAAGTSVDVAGALACTDPASIEATGCDAGACTVVFTPDAAFALSSTITLTLQGGTRADGAVESFRATDAGGQLPADVTSSFIVRDPLPLVLTASDPGNGATLVDLDSDLVLTFSEDIDCSTLTVDDLTVTQTLDTGAVGPVLAVSIVSCVGDTVTLGFDPSFNYSATIDVVIGEGVESAVATNRGGQLDGGALVSFTTVDPPPLVLVGSNPGNGATLVGLDSDLVLTFSEDLNCSSFTIDDVTVTQTLDSAVTGPAITVAVVSCVGDTVTLGFDPSFNFSATIDVAIGAGVESAIATTRGGQLDGGALISFTTEDPPVLRVVRTDPGNGAALAGVGTNLTVELSEAVDCATVGAAVTSAGGLTVRETFDAVTAARRGSATVDHVVTVASCAGSTVVFDVDVDLELSSSVVVVLPGTIASLRATTQGGQLEDGLGYTWSFTTDDPSVFVVVFTSPGDGNILVPQDDPVVVRFSEAINPLSVTDQTLVIEQLSRDVAGNFTVVAAISAGCVAGTGPCTYDVVGDTVTFTPPADLEFNTFYRMTLTTGLASARATNRGGNLPVALTYTWKTVATPPIEVVSVEPPGNSLLSQTTSIVVTFNQDVFNVETGLGGAVPPTVFLTEIVDPNAAPDVANAVALTCENGCATGDVYSFRAAAALTTGLYALVIKGGFEGVRGTVGGSFMLDDVIVLYRVVGGGLLVSTDPADGDVDVAVTEKVCAVFLRNIDPTLMDESGFTLTATDDLLGETVLPATYEVSGVDPFTGLPDTSGAFTSNKICIVPQPSTLPCRDVVELLPAGTEVTLVIDFNDQSDPEQPIVVDTSISFTTAGLPSLVDSRFESIPQVGISGALDGQIEIPVNGTLVLTFDADVNAASLAAITLKNAAGATIAASVTVSPDAPDEVVIVPAALLAFNTGHVIDVAGGTDGLLFVDGRYLGSDESVRFTTSPANAARISPIAGENALVTSVTPFVFDRPMFLPSLNTNTITVINETAAGAVVEGAVATAVDDVFSGVFSPLPTYVDLSRVRFTIGTGALDFLGNPLPAAVTVTWPAIGGAAAANARSPDVINNTNVAPNAGAVLGDQVFVLTMPISANAKLLDRMLPQSFNNSSVVLEQIGTCGGVAAHVITSENRFSIAGGAGNADVIRIRAASELLRSGCAYRLTLKQSKFANIHTISNSGADVVLNFTGETTLPTLVSTNVDANPVNVGGGQALTATFSEKLDPATVSSTTVTLTDVVLATTIAGTATAVVVGTASVVTFTPAALLDAGRQYRLTLVGGAAGLRDLAGNALAASQTRTFTVEVTPPTVTTTAAEVGGTIRVTFSEAVDPASVVETTFAGGVALPGTITVRDSAGVDVVACIDVVGNALVIRPAGVAAGTVLTVVVTTGVTDLAGNALAANNTATVTTLP